MKKLIMLKYGELTTKKENINLFIRTLYLNIKQKLVNYNIEITYDKGRMFLSVLDNQFDEVVEELKEVFGIHEIITCYELDTLDLEEIKKHILELVQDRQFTTFKIETKRSNKTIPKSSVEISSEIGGYLLKNKNGLKVDVHHSEVTIHIELRSKESYIYFEAEEGLGGYPVGTLGKGILMLSGGIDSPVAGFMAIKRGVKLEGIYFESPPHTSVEAKNKVKELSRVLSKFNLEFKLHVIPFTEIQEAIYKNIPHEYLITIMRRMMYRISAIIASRSNAKVLVNGESIGQVASQTLTSMKAINEVVHIPVIRPVACFDKLEIIAVAKKIGTYETSILPYEDCCTIFVPEHPVINPDSKLCSEYEKLIPFEELIYEAVKKHEIIKISQQQKNDYEDLL